MSIITMEDLKSGMCRWPVGDPKDDDFHFCGKPGEPGISYCQNHTELAHNSSSGNRGQTKKKAA